MAPHNNKTSLIPNPAYHITKHPIVVHWDMDVAILQPMDDLYDAMLYPSSHPIGAAARSRIEKQHPDDPWPETIDAFLTRDITSAKPWEKVTAVQGGFLVARPDKAVFDKYIEFIKEGNYTKGRGDGTGWGGLGYGGFQGAMAYQVSNFDAIKCKIWSCAFSQQINV